MPKSSRWICRECDRICVSRPALSKEWCACGHYLLPDPIEIPRPRVHIEIDWSKCHVQLTAAGWLRVLKEAEARRAQAERLGHHDWQQDVDEDDVLDALDRALQRRSRK
jgi:hypothetical protein